MKREITCIVCPRGCRMTADIQGEQITVTGHKLDYLRQMDQMKLTVEISTERQSMEGSGFILPRSDDDFQYVLINYYDAGINNFSQCHFAYNKAFTEFRIVTSRYIYIASTTGADPSTLFHTFAERFPPA